jgi:predicted nucleic acid-binding protein
LSAYFVDTSALVKRYIAEIGSQWMVSWTESVTNNVIVVSEIAYVEIRSAIARRVREGSLSRVNAIRDAVGELILGSQ